MAACEFIKYIPVENEKYLGIVTVKRKGDLLRFKWVLKKDGKGTFPSACSIKMVQEGQDVYLPAFVLDSMQEKEEMDEIIRVGVNKTIAELKGRPQIQMQQSVFTDQPSYEPKQSDECPF